MQQPGKPDQISRIDAVQNRGGRPAGMAEGKDDPARAAEGHDRGERLDKDLASGGFGDHTGERV